MYGIIYNHINIIYIYQYNHQIVSDSLMFPVCPDQLQPARAPGAPGAPGQVLSPPPFQCVSLQKSCVSRMVLIKVAMEQVPINRGFNVFLIAKSCLNIFTDFPKLTV